MKKMGLKSIIVKKYRPSGSKGKVDDTNKPNLLAQNFKAEGLREKLVSDITYIYTKEKGWTYLAIVMDLYSMSVIEYSYGNTMDVELVIKKQYEMQGLKENSKQEQYFIAIQVVNILLIKLRDISKNWI